MNDMFTKEWWKQSRNATAVALGKGIATVFRAVGTFIRLHWRESIAFIALVLLATSAAYGVYVFSLLFVPHIFALITAGAFEATYIGLGVAKLSGEQRAHATWISGSAVAVSIIYNTLSAIFHLLPAVTISIATATGWVSITGIVILAILHGAPLALTAFFLSSLILHKNDTGAEMGNDEYKALIIERCIAEGMNTTQIYKIVGGDRTKTWALINSMRATTP